MNRLIARLGLLLILIAPSAQAAPQIVPVRSPGGITAWLWQDDSVPVIAIRASFRGGAWLDPKPGVSRLMDALTGFAAGPYDEVSYARQVETLSASISISHGTLADRLNIRLLRDRRAETADLVAVTVTTPIVTPLAFERARQGLLRGLSADERQPAAQAGRLASRLFLGDQFPQLTTRLLPVVDAIQIEDLYSVHRDRMTRAALRVSVSGAISPVELGPLLDRMFGGLPEGGPPPVPERPSEQPQPGTYVLPMPGAPQTHLLTALPAPARDDPDFWSVLVLNQVFGGGTFTSRLKMDLRERRGMVYSTGSALSIGGLRPLWSASAAFAPDRSGEAIAAMTEQWRLLREGGITQAELESARDYLLGSLALSLDSTPAMADFIAGLQQDNLPATYFTDREAALRALTLDQVNAAVKRWVDPDKLVTIIAGQPQPNLPPSLPLPEGF
ncbi:M16 family metallopeptidase [Elstera sp.]|jgi:zinc protease|uniref:M16 family metallopeptidase n=1 Tax=Elstera sp. TaxID=1916664 RepID=UPI0037BE54D3